MSWNACLVIVVADQLSKWWIVHRVGDRRLLGDLLRLTVTENTGAAFGMFPGARTAFVIISIAAAIALVYAIRSLGRRDSRRLLLALILGGNLGNLIDRLRWGHVVDFIDMGIGATRWPVYNLADVAVVAGAAGLGFLLWTNAARSERRLAAAPAPPASRDAPEEPAAR